MPRIHRTAPGRVLVLALALLGATLDGDHGAVLAPVPAPAAGIAPSALVVGATGAAGGLASVAGHGVDVNYCTACAAAGFVTQQTV